MSLEWTHRKSGRSFSDLYITTRAEVLVEQSPIFPPVMDHRAHRKLFALMKDRPIFLYMAPSCLMSFMGATTTGHLKKDQMIFLQWFREKELVS